MVTTSVSVVTLVPVVPFRWFRWFRWFRSGGFAGSGGSVPVVTLVPVVPFRWFRSVVPFFKARSVSTGRPKRYLHKFNIKLGSRPQNYKMTVTINVKTSDLEQQLNFEAEFGVNQFRDTSVPRRKH